MKGKPNANDVINNLTAAKRLPLINRRIDD